MKAVEVSIMGQKFTVRSESSEGYIQQVSKFVDNKVTEVMHKTNSVASVNVALLAAMNIADEYMKFRQDKQDHVTKVEKKINDMIELIDLQL